MPFKLSLVADVRQWLKGTADVEKSLDDVADSLDDLARDTADNANKAADSLEREFKDAFDQVKTESRTTGRKVGDDIHDGTKRAGEGLSEFKDEAKGTAREAAASFDGSAESISDAFQEVAANAFAGFGPAGAAAGIAAALGLGAAIGALENAEDAAHDTLAKTHDLADALAEVGGSPEAINWAEQLRDTMKEIVDGKQWWEFWQGGDIDRLADWTAKTREFGLTQAQVMRAATGDQAALAQVTEVLNGKVQELNDAYAAGGGTNDAILTAIPRIQAFRDDIAGQARVVSDATGWQQAYTDATKDLTKATTGQTDAQNTASQAVAEFSNNLTDHLSVSDEGLDSFVKDAKTSWAAWNKKIKEATAQGVLDIDAWADEVKRRAKDNKVVTSFTVDVSSKLSPEALAQFEQLPTETQAQIARAYKKGDKGDRKKIVQTLNLEAKVDKVEIDTSSAQATADANPVTVPATVNTTTLPGDTRKAADAAQSEANKSSNHIEFTPKLDTGDLQRAVNRAAASITPPTIYVNVKTRKEVP